MFEECFIFSEAVTFVGLLGSPSSPVPGARPLSVQFLRTWERGHGDRAEPGLGHGGRDSQRAWVRRRLTGCGGRGGGPAGK